jgi:hypothetical protein
MVEIYWKTRDLKVINATCNNLGIGYHVSINYTTGVDMASMTRSQREHLRNCERCGLLEVRIIK